MLETIQNLKKVSNDVLLEQTHKLVSEERKITSAILHYLREIQDRRLYALRGYSSLFSFCVSELKYSEASAQRRISSMRMLREIPEIENSINDGKLNVTAISKVSSLAKVANLNTEEKREALKAIEGQSKVETEKTLNKLLVEKLGEEKTKEILIATLQKQTSKPVIPGFNEVKLVMEDELISQLEKVKALHFHKLKNPESLTELIQFMTDLVLDKTDPERIEKKIETKKTEKLGFSAEVNRVKQAFTTEKSVITMSMPVTPAKAGVHSQCSPTRYIPQSTRRQVFLKSQGRCSYTDPKTKRQCAETRGLQIDHIHSFAQGGSNQIDNLRLYCRTHNLLHGIQVYGEKKIFGYLGKR